MGRTTSESNKSGWKIFRQKSGRNTTPLWFLPIFVTLVLFPQKSRAETGEYDLKASFLYNFTQFVSWPETAFSAADTPFQLCLVGEDPFGRVLDEKVITEKVNKHPIFVRRIRNLENTPACHLVFVESKTEAPVEFIMDLVKGRSVLVVGETTDFAERGGTIALHHVERRIHLEINLAAARNANLKISSKLLKLSGIVE